MPTDRPPSAPETASLDLAALIRPGDLVVWGQGSALPRGLVAQLWDQASDIGPMRCFEGYGLTAESAPRPWRTVSYTGTGHARAEQDDTLEIWPCHYSELPGLLGPAGPATRRADVVLVQATSAGPDGHYRFALAVDYVVAAVAAARVVVVEVNERAPLLPDAPLIDPRRVTAWTRAAYDPLELEAGAPGPVEEAIARNVAALIDDGATLQMGLGKIPQTALGLLTDRTDLGIHSGLFGEVLLDLVESGAVTNRRKGRDTDASVTGWLLGTARLYGWAAGRRDVRLAPIPATHDPDVLASLPRLVTVNSAVEVDLSGQVNCEVARGRYVGGVGGALDFARGARRSSGGVPVIALPATAGRDGTTSRIVTRLSGPATIGRADAVVVVTEHGVADLRGLSLDARREALLAVADPHHRSALQAGHGNP